MFQFPRPMLQLKTDFFSWMEKLSNNVDSAEATTQNEIAFYSTLSIHLKYM